MVYSHYERCEMIRTTIFLPKDLHASLKHLAVERECSMANLLREAAERLYEEDLSDLRAARWAWATHSRVAERAISAKEYFAKRKKRV
jgi:predicted DNA-binding ribbon-helix-helix protein